METLKEIKDYLRDNVNEGCRCPACNQMVKLYKRKIYTTQARALILLSRLQVKSEWVHVREIMKRINITGDFAKMSYWGLIEEQRSDLKEKRTSGNWKITEKGINFVRNETSIPSHVLIYNGKKIGFSETDINIIEVLGKKFNYYELLNN